MKNIQLILKKILIFFLSIFSFSTNADVMTVSIDINKSTQQIEARMIEARRKLLEKDKFKKTSKKQDIAQWYNWPNWPNWYNGWRNF